VEKKIASRLTGPVTGGVFINVRCFVQYPLAGMRGGFLRGVLTSPRLRGEVGAQRRVRGRLHTREANDINNTNAKRARILRVPLEARKSRIAIAGSPHPDRTGDAPHRQSNPTPPRARLSDSHISSCIIPGRAIARFGALSRELGIHNPHREYGFRA
jgi:hypothetical protein